MKTGWVRIGCNRRIRRGKAENNSRKWCKEAFRHSKNLAILSPRIGIKRGPKPIILIRIDKPRPIIDSLVKFGTRTQNTMTMKGNKTAKTQI